MNKDYLFCTGGDVEKTWVRIGPQKFGTEFFASLTGGGDQQKPEQVESVEQCDAPAIAAEDAEAHRVAGELLKIHQHYRLDEETEQAFLAAAMMRFHATFDGVGEREGES